MCYNFNDMGWPTKAQQFIEDFITKILLGWLAVTALVWPELWVGGGLRSYVNHLFFFIIMSSVNQADVLVWCSQRLAFSHTVASILFLQEKKREGEVSLPLLSFLWFSYFLPHWLFVCLFVCWCCFVLCTYPSMGSNAMDRGISNSSSMSTLPILPSKFVSSMVHLCVSVK